MTHLRKELSDNYFLAAGAGFEPANAGLTTGAGFRLARCLDIYGGWQNSAKLKWVRQLKLLRYS
jgi:hypothetical protein